MIFPLFFLIHTMYVGKYVCTGMQNMTVLVKEMSVPSQQTSRPSYGAQRPRQQNSAQVKTLP